MSTSLVALRMKFLQAHQSKPLADLAKSDSKHRSHKFSLPKGRSDFTGKSERQLINKPPKTKSFQENVQSRFLLIMNVVCFSIIECAGSAAAVLVTPSGNKCRQVVLMYIPGHEKALRRSCSARNAAQFATRKRPASTITFSPVRVARTSSAVPSLKVALIRKIRIQMLFC